MSFVVTSRRIFKFPTVDQRIVSVSTMFGEITDKILTANQNEIALNGTRKMVFATEYVDYLVRTKTNHMITKIDVINRPVKVKLANDFN